MAETAETAETKETIKKDGTRGNAARSEADYGGG